MPPLLEFVMTWVVILATLFLLAWFVARERMSRRVKVAGWAAVTLSVLSMLWSLWYESLAPYLRLGRGRAALLTLGSFALSVVGIVAVIYGGTRVLRWLFARKESGVHARQMAALTPQATPSPRRRFRLLAAYLLSLALAPGLGWVLLGVGLMAGPANALSDFGLDRRQIAWSVVLILLGLVQIWQARRA